MNGNDGWLPKMARELATKALPLLVTGAGFLGFVAFVGAAITWARFFAAKLPAGQAVEAVPRSDLIATGAAALTLFAILGALAVLAVYLINSQGLPSKRMLMGLLLIAFVESSVVVVLEAPGQWGDAAVVLACIAAIGAVTIFVIQKLVTDPSDPVQAAKIDVWAYIICGGLGIGAGVLAALLLEEWWLAVALPLSGLLGYAVFRVAASTQRRFEWFGVAMFASVAVFGGVVGVLRAIAKPELQPAALIRDGDGVKEGLQALYVAEDDTRVWLATVATGSCNGDDLRGDSGRLFSVPADEVDLLVLGPPQRVRNASRRSLEMLQDLIAVRTVAATATAAAKPKPQAAKAKARARRRARSLAAWPAVRQDPRIDRIEPPRVRAGRRIVITGSGFGHAAGGIEIGGAGAKVVEWSDGSIEAKVPRAARGGHVSIVCRRAVSPQVIGVVRPPEARARVTRVRGRTRIYRLDARRSRDPDGRIVDYSWSIDDKEIKTGRRVRARLPRGLHVIRLDVTDDDNGVDEVSLPVRVRQR